MRYIPHCIGMVFEKKAVLKASDFQLIVKDRFTKFTTVENAPIIHIIPGNRTVQGNTFSNDIRTKKSPKELNERVQRDVVTFVILTFMSAASFA